MDDMLQFGLEILSILGLFLTSCNGLSELVFAEC